MQTHKELNTVSWMWMLFFIVLGMAGMVVACLSITLYYYYCTIDKEHIHWLQKKCIDPLERKHVLKISDVCIRMDQSGGDILWVIAYEKLNNKIHLLSTLKMVFGIPFAWLVVILVVYVYQLSRRSAFYSQA